MTIFWCLVILFYATDLSYADCTVDNCASCEDGSCTECQDAYYLSNSSSLCIHCRYTCANCTGDVTCFSCVSEKCYLCTNNCTQDMCHGVNCTHCSDGFYLYSGECFRCFNLGCTCNEANGCDECLSGWYGDSCNITCSENCSECNKSGCIECVTGAFGQNCESPCPDDCKDNVCDKENGTCTKGCNSGKFGSHCENDCPSFCLSDICDADTGICTSGCIADHNVSAGICPKCLEHCINCMSVNKCSKCEDGFYVKSGKCFACPTRCQICSDYEHCSVCHKENYWGENCAYDCVGCHSYCNRTNGCFGPCDQYYHKRDFKGGFECKRCPNTKQSMEQCLTCTNESYCSECTTGFWGSICQNTCSRCEGGYCDKNTGCYSNCSAGHSLIQTETESYCIKCPDFCETCASNTSCQICRDGFYSLNNGTCLNCSANCNNSAVCNRQTGACSGGCIIGWRGEKCDIECQTACLACEQMPSGNCSTCRQGYYGNKCEYNCSSHCAIFGDKQICEKENGTCIQGCQNFFWGHDCKNSCNVGCKGSVCNAKNGVCVNGCIDHFYGISCDKPCSTNCQLVETNSSERSCDSESGHCIHSCKAGWYGTFCRNKCKGHCNGSVCNPSGGKCTFGCEKGYIGDKCDQEQVFGTTSPKEEGNNATVIGAAAGAGAALLIFVAVIAFVFIILRRRRRASQEDTSKLSVNLEATTSGTAEEPTYSRIEKKRAIDSTGSAKTAGSIALKDTAPHYNTDTLTNQACPEALKCAKRESIFIKQSHEEDACQVSREEELLEETEFAGKSDPNTYYNTTGRRIPLEKLADYVALKAMQDVENEFQKLPHGLSTEKEYTVARQRNNILKNRYKFIYPYDESRVVLKDGGKDFINASYIEGFNRPREYIGAMGPFEKGDVDTVPDFWRMIWQEQCETIVMLTNLVENMQTKCKQYWPDPGTSKTYGDLHVACTTEDVYADFIVRSFTVTKQDGETLRVRHLHFTAWPDKTISDDVTCLIEFRQKVRSLHKEKTCPIIVHCSAGIGRTGTFVALDILTFEGEDRGYIDIFGCVATIRSQRVNLVQTPEQYVYLHHSVVHSLTFNCQAIQGDMFIEHYRKLNEKTDGSTAIAKQYEKLQSSFPEQSLEGSSLIQNKTLANKIRKGADLPGDGYRVILHENRKPGASDFINAAFVNGFRTRRKFIAAQTPLPATVVDFLSMVIQEKCSCIVMMDEPSLQDKSVGVYWPADNQVIKHGVFQVSCVKSESFPNYTVKKLALTCHGQDKESTHDVHLFMFTAWPRESLTPKTPESLLELIKAVDVQARGSANKGSVIVNCMTGSQRSCLYCAVSVLIEKMEIEHEVSVVNTLRQIKSRRHSAIPALEQYKFCHQAIVCYLQSFIMYSNFGLRSSHAVGL